MHNMLVKYSAWSTAQDLQCPCSHSLVQNEYTTCDILGYILKNDAKIVHFIFSIIFSGGTWATPRHPHVWSGAEQVRKLNEPSGSRKVAERWAGVTERGESGERKFWPLPLRSHALMSTDNCVCFFLVVHCCYMCDLILRRYHLFTVQYT